MNHFQKAENTPNNDYAKKLKKTLSFLEGKLLNAINTDGHWTGYLSSSALSTAVAVFALAQVDKVKNKSVISTGLTWLANNQNEDGGWGDTPASPSNLSTTLLAISAFTLDTDNQFSAIKANAEDWLQKQVGSTEAEKVVPAVLDNYNDDRTFSAPILTKCTLAGLFGKNDPKTWQLVPQLPFEMAVLPHALYKFFNLSVVSYAIPALIAIGLVKHKKQPTSNIFLRILRNLITNKALKILKSKQPENGGFLEATPLTGFVTMSLATAGYKDSSVVKKGVEFLLSSRRPDGSWPIDTNLSVWLTTLSVNALSVKNSTALDNSRTEIIQQWLLERQYKTTHPYTCAPPGGWGWTNLSGGVPDADDTSGALLALYNLGKIDTTLKNAAADGISWLINLQNKDGGIPTFCKGWGKLPFDISCPDITAHACAAFIVWHDEMEIRLQNKMRSSLHKMVEYLLHNQKKNGTWIPLWFGNQHSENKQNPVYGTAKVINYLRSTVVPGFIAENHSLDKALDKGIQWLIKVKSIDGGWGGDADTPSSIEETAVAISALASDPETKKSKACSEAAEWLIKEINRISPEENLPSSPIGLYFASLWYDEKLYPLIFAIEALRKLK